MKRILTVAGVVAGVVLVFLAGVWTGHRPSGGAAAAGERKVLYWVDPMHPSYKADRAGIAPDCGMQLEPVYEDGSTGDGRTLPAGAAKVTPERRQMIGVRVGTVGKEGGARTLRTLGRVAADERRVYRLVAATDGWVREISHATVGSVVRKGETLASYYSPESLGTQQSYLYALTALERFEASGRETPDQIRQANVNLQSARDALENLGMSGRQVEELRKSRETSQNIDIVSPADAFVLARDVSLGQRFEKGTELFRLADLSRVWILADLFEREGQDVRPGQAAEVSLPYQARRFGARVSDVPPIFDPQTRTLKVRLEMANPGRAMRPEMFVDVKFDVGYGPTLTVPADAVLDSGLRQTVYVETGPGVFQPRRVETGRDLGDSVEVVAGLEAGERVVLDGNFLIDSESRMRAAVAGVRGDSSQDPVCGMDVDETRARATGLTSQRGGVTYFFCSESCKKGFDAGSGNGTVASANGGPERG